MSLRTDTALGAPVCRGPYLETQSLVTQVGESGEQTRAFASEERAAEVLLQNAARKVGTLAWHRTDLMRLRVRMFLNYLKNDYNT